MRISKILLFGFFAVTHLVSAKVNIAVSVLRSGAVTLGTVGQLEFGQQPVKVFQDYNTYIEAELMSEKDNTPLIRFTVASKNESGVLVVRGMPQLATALVNGLGISSMQCDGKNESFTLMLAISKA